MRTIIFLALLGYALAVPEQAPRIVGGADANIVQYPYMSNMQYGFWGIWWYQACGGTLLSRTAVVSAAHCYNSDSASSWRVRLGSSKASSGGTVYNVAKIIVHSEYNSKSMVNDIAIIKLQVAATISDSVKVARIAGANYNLPDGVVVYAAGWGKLSASGSSSEQLQHVAINVINQNICADRYAYLKRQPGYSHIPTVTSGMLCAGILNVGGKDTCNGDSGGPLAHKGDILVGITSWGYSCAHWYYPGVNTRVSTHSNWIVRNA